MSANIADSQNTYNIYIVYNLNFGFVLGFRSRLCVAFFRIRSHFPLSTTIFFLRKAQEKGFSLQSGLGQLYPKRATLQSDTKTVEKTFAFKKRKFSELRIRVKIKPKKGYQKFGKAKTSVTFAPALKQTFLLIY